ncbi:MAG: hypothetical protein KJ864_06385, partial [Candidatus Omnitrophica bacterium]|nr:hypothetical protein [Candidatus Omnitrophota bacterium]
CISTLAPVTALDEGKVEGDTVNLEKGDKGQTQGSAPTKIANGTNVEGKIKTIPIIIGLMASFFIIFFSYKFWRNTQNKKLSTEVPKQSLQVMDQNARKEKSRLNRMRLVSKPEKKDSFIPASAGSGISDDLCGIKSDKSLFEERVDYTDGSFVIEEEDERYGRGSIDTADIIIKEYLEQAFSKHIEQRDLDDEADRTFSEIYEYTKGGKLDGIEKRRYRQHTEYWRDAPKGKDIRKYQKVSDVDGNVIRETFFDETGMSVEEIKYFENTEFKGRKKTQRIEYAPLNSNIRDDQELRRKIIGFNPDGSIKEENEIYTSRRVQTIYNADGTYEKIYYAPGGTKQQTVYSDGVGIQEQSIDATLNSSSELMTLPRKKIKLSVVMSLTTMLILGPAIVSAGKVAYAAGKPAMLSSVENVRFPIFFGLVLVSLTGVIYFLAGRILNGCDIQTKKSSFFGNKGQIKKISFLLMPVVLIGLGLGVIFYRKNRKKADVKKPLVSDIAATNREPLIKHLDVPPYNSLLKKLNQQYSAKQKPQVSDSVIKGYPEVSDEIKNNPYFIERRFGDPWPFYIDVYVDPTGRYDSIEHLYDLNGRLNRIDGYYESGAKYVLKDVRSSGACDEYEYLENGNVREWFRDPNGVLEAYTESYKDGRRLSHYVWEDGLLEEMNFYERDNETDSFTKYTYDGTGREFLGGEVRSNGLVQKTIGPDWSYQEIDRDAGVKRNYDPYGNFMSIEKYDESGNVVEVTDPNGNEIQRIFDVDDIHGDISYVYTCFPGTDQEEKRVYCDEAGNFYKQMKWDEKGNSVCQEEETVEGVTIKRTSTISGSNMEVSIEEKLENTDIVIRKQTWKNGVPVEMIGDFQNETDIAHRYFLYDGGAAVEEQYDATNNLIGTVEYDSIEDLLNKFSPPDRDIPVNTDDDVPDFDKNIKVLPNVKSLELADKSMYEMKMDNIHKQIFSNIQMSLEAKGFIQKFKGQDVPERYISVSA